MRKSQQWLLTLLALFFAHSIFAQTSIDIEIKGVSSEIEENIRFYLSLEQQKSDALLSEARLRRLHKKSSQEIAQAMQPYGYYRPIITSDLTEITTGSWKAIYTIDNGPALPVKAFTFKLNEEASQDPEFQALTESLPLNPGDTFNHLIYEEFKSDLAKLAAERGYFKAKFIEHKIEINLKLYEATIYLNFDGGQRYYFGEVALEQNILDNDLLQRYILFKRGSPYSIKQLLELQQALTDSDYFINVEVSPGEPDTNNNEIPVNINLTPRKRHRFSIGIGYGTDTGARGKLGWEIPRLNTAGHRVNTEAKLSEIGHSLKTFYRIPILNPRTDQLVYSAGIVNEETDTSESTVRTIGSSLHRSRNQWRESFALNYQQEDYIVADDRGSSSLLIPSVNWSRTWGNNFIYTLDGLRFDLNLSGANEKLFSDTDFLQILGNIKAISKIGEHNRIITRGQLGSTWVDDFSELPASVRFFAGGAQSVRGYAYESLGPVDENGEVVGGKHLMLGSIEFEHSFTNKWSMAIFYDAGNAIDDFADDLERGTGIGLRWKSPIGAVRIDFANAVSQDDKPWRIHINIGPDL